MLFEDIPPDQLPHVTVLIATHNYAEWVCDAIKSAFGQTYKNFEVYVIDDASTDNTGKVIHDEFFKKVPHEKRADEKVGELNGVKLTYRRLENNLGPSGARNAAIDATIERTDVYAILDADDMMHHQKLSRCVMAMMASNAVGVVYADYDIVNTTTGMVTREYKEPFDRKRLEQECIVHSGSLIKAQALRDVKDEFGYYDQHLRTCEDYDLWLRISEKYVIFHVAEPLTIVRVQPKNSTDTVAKDIWAANHRRVFEKLRARQ